ncbi:hypothetical protein HZA97_02090 [Candidatus Woesearchaeota archaeon]|nr:hypothetical protein [Candidatus Woesearchaeota archaeon]
MKVVGEIKPDWTVVKYETEADFKEAGEKGFIFDLCRGLINYDFVLDASTEQSNYVKDGTCFMMVRINLDSVKVKLKISPMIKGFKDLEEVVKNINPEFIDKQWHEFKGYEEMVKQAAKDYGNWAIYTEQKND